jgi:hypothetical protein
MAIINQEELAEILQRLAKKIGINDETNITIGEICKKIHNQNLCYQSETKEINLMNPDYKNAFFIRNAELQYDRTHFPNTFEHDCVVSLKLVNNNKIQLTDINNKKVYVDYDGDNVKVKLKEIPVDLYLKLIG